MTQRRRSGRKKPGHKSPSEAKNGGSADSNNAASTGGSSSGNHHRHKEGKVTRSSNTKSNPKTQSQWLWGAGVTVALFAVVIAMLSTLQNYKGIDPTTKALIAQVCGHPFSYCNDALVPTRRTQKAIRPLNSGDRILRIPRELQIWELDAMQDEFVHTLLPVRHKKTLNPLDGGAFLAVYLCRLSQQIDSEQETQAGNDTTQKRNAVLRHYLRAFPSLEDFEAHHPLLWEESELTELIGTFSSTFLVVRAYRDMIDREYDAFCEISREFRETISQDDYLHKRLLVLSRSFGTLPLKEEEYGPIVSELEEKSGVNLSKGNHAMVPILDLYNHHAQSNVEFRFQDNEFVVQAKRHIPAGQEIIDSYGKYTDPHLFAKHGFINGDGSGHTEAKLSVYHRVLDVGLQQRQFSYLPFDNWDRRAIDAVSMLQRRDMIRYLQFDDGYETCIHPMRNRSAFAFKKLKLEHLVRTANIAKRWIVQMPPRDKFSLPAFSSDVPITSTPPAFVPRDLQFDGSFVASTCRLISLNENDYDGNATDVLQQALEDFLTGGNNSNADKSKSALWVDPMGDALELRALMCLARLVSMAMSRFPRKPEEELAHTAQMNREMYGTKNWTAAHLRLGELQTLETIKTVVFVKLHDYRDRFNESVDFLVRDEPCPFEYQEALLGEVQ